MRSFLWTLSLKFKGTSFSGPMLIEIPEVGTRGRNTHQDMRKRGIIGLKIGLRPYHDNSSSSSTKSSAPSSAGNRGRGSYSSRPLEAGSDCLCPGSRLSSFWQVWETKNAHLRVVTILKEGYCLNFRNQPPLTNYPAIRSKYLNREKQDFLIKAVYQMIDKKAITPVQKVTSLGFYSRLFLVPKLGKKWRPVIDLSVVNQYLHIPTFKMETAEKIRDSLQEGELVTSLNLRDAYFHIPIHPRFQKYLRFNVGDRSYQFTALPFGIAMAPLEFTMVATEVKLMALAEDIRIHQYIDDCLMRAKTKQQCQENTHRLIHLVQSLGWIINFEKWDLIPTQEIEFWGYKFDLRVGLVFPAQKKIDRLLENSFHVGISSNISKEAHVTYWKHGFNGEDNSIRSSTHEATPMVSEDTLEVSPVSGYPSTCVPGSQTASSVVDQSFELEEGFPTSSEGAQSPSIHRCFPKRLGCSLKALHSQWSVESGGVKTSHKHSRAKGSVSSFKIIRKSASE